MHLLEEIALEDCRKVNIIINSFYHVDVIPLNRTIYDYPRTVIRIY